jgi:aminobenzoyl-glutamate utilization protein B
MPLVLLVAAVGRGQQAVSASAEQLVALRQEAVADGDSRAKLAQVMVDTIFSYGELGFQQFETSKYLTDLLEKNGFKVERAISAIPTAWMATWGEGKPVIALGSDLDCIPPASPKPGVAYHDPIVNCAPGHGEGPNSGQAVNIIAALVAKDLMVKNHLKGTIKIWPGVAEELLGTKAYYVRDGQFKGVDAVLFSQVGTKLGTHRGGGFGTGLVSVQYNFDGESAHAAMAPRRGKSPLDAVERMDVEREHLRPSQRSHYVITNGGDQPNVVPPNARVWYSIRDTDYAHIKMMWAAGDKMAEGARWMTQTTTDSTVLGAAWPGHFNQALAEDQQENVKWAGMPQWSAEDQMPAKAVLQEIKAPQQGLDTTLAEMRPPRDPALNQGGPSDDIGDVSWNVPTFVLSYPSNIPNLPGHDWIDGISMATPLAHQGVIAGAKVQARTLLDLLTKPELAIAAWDYFTHVQTKQEKYVPFLRPQDKPAISMLQATMDKYRPEMKKDYYDSTKYGSYLQQLGVKHPTIRAEPLSAMAAPVVKDESEDLAMATLPGASF